MTIPVHAQQTLDDIAAIRQRLDDAEAAIRAVYGSTPPAPPAPVVPIAPLAVVIRDSVARPRRAKREPTEEASTAASTKRQGVRSIEARQAQMGGKYDEGILRALRSETAQYGLPLSDVTRALVGPGKPAEVKRLIGTVYGALQSLQKRGQVRRDGRMWHVVRAHDRAESA